MRPHSGVIPVSVWCSISLFPNLLHLSSLSSFLSPHRTPLNTHSIVLESLCLSHHHTLCICVCVLNLSHCQCALISITGSRVLGVWRGEKGEDNQERALRPPPPLLAFHADHTVRVSPHLFTLVRLRPLLPGRAAEPHVLIMPPPPVIADCKSHIIKLMALSSR